MYDGQQTLKQEKREGKKIHITYGKRYNSKKKCKPKNQPWCCRNGEKYF